MDILKIFGIRNKTKEKLEKLEFKYNNICMERARLLDDIEQSQISIKKLNANYEDKKKLAKTWHNKSNEFESKFHKLQEEISKNESNEHKYFKKYEMLRSRISRCEEYIDKKYHNPRGSIKHTLNKIKDILDGNKNTRGKINANRK